MAGAAGSRVHEWTDPVYRIQDDRISSRSYPKPRYRFDAPGGEYAVLYANDTKVTTFNESYAEKRRRIPKGDAKRHLVRIMPKRPLPLVDLRDDRTLSALDLDARISVGDDYVERYRVLTRLYAGQGISEAPLDRASTRTQRGSNSGSGRNDTRR